MVFSALHQLVIDRLWGLTRGRQSGARPGHVQVTSVNEGDLPFRRRSSLWELVGQRRARCKLGVGQSQRDRGGRVGTGSHFLRPLPAEPGAGSSWAGVCPRHFGATPP